MVPVPETPGPRKAHENWLLSGNIVGLQPGAVIDSYKSGKRFQVMGDGELTELPDQGWATIPDDDR